MKAMTNYERAMAENRQLSDALKNILDAYENRFANGPNGARLFGPIDEEIRAARKLIPRSTL